MTTPNRLVRFGPVAACSIIVAASFLFAGPLNPPAGPIASTGKTLTEVEPRTAINLTNTPGDADSLFKITQPGSYYLTGNITGVVGQHGIEIVASGVTIDLNGFDVVGVPAMGAFDGVSVTVIDITNIALLNGSVRNWGDEGVDLGSFGANNCRVEGVIASGNTGNGIRISNGGTVLNCSAFQNTGNGIETDNSCTVSNCSSLENTLDGIQAGTGSTVVHSSAQSNGRNGIIVSNSSTVSHCSASSNGNNGINTSLGCIVSHCTGSRNTRIGILTTEGCTVSNCTAYNNSTNGISVGSGCTVADCTARLNLLNGIVCVGGCTIRGNTCVSNGSGVANDGSGINVVDSDNRIEGNNCIGADRGIDVDDLGNIIIRNTCSANTINWSIAVGNSVGPIVVAGTNAAAINGNGAVASTLGSTDPNANFSY